MNREEYEYLQEQRAGLNGLLDLVPEDAVADRISLQSRRDRVAAKLAAAPAPRPDTTTRQERARRAPTAPRLMLAELDDVAAYAEEIGVETPSAAAFDKARRLVEG